MQTLNIKEAGFSYIFKCVGYYSEGSAYLLLYLAALIFIAVKGSRKERLIFLPQAVMALLTVFNPVFPVVLNSFFDVNKEYYRFLWILPVTTAAAFAAAKLVTQYSKNAIKAVLAFFMCICIFVTAGNFIYEGGYQKIENIYKMPSELPQVASIIHRDSKVKYPRAMLEYDYSMQMRQYDASILLSCDREAYLNAVTGGLDYTTIMADENYYNRLLAVVALNMRLDEEAFLEGLEKTNTEYIVLTRGSDMINYCKDMGLKEVGNTVNHTVLHYDLKEGTEFELADYSEVWKMQGF